MAKSNTKGKIDSLLKNPTDTIHIRFTEANAKDIVEMLSGVMKDEVRSLNNAIESIMVKAAADWKRNKSKKKTKATT